MEKEEEKEKKHTPEEVLEAVNEVLTLTQRIKKSLEEAIALPEMMKKLEARGTELNQRAENLTQEAITNKNEGKTKEALAALKKKKLLESEIKKVEEKKVLVLKQMQKEEGSISVP